MTNVIDLAYTKYGPLTDDITHLSPNTKFFGKDWFSHVIRKPNNELVWVVKEVKFPNYIQKFNIFGENNEYIGFSSLMNGHTKNDNDVIFQKTNFHGTDYYVLLYDNPIQFPIDGQIFAYDAYDFEHEINTYKMIPDNKRKYTPGCQIITDFNFPGKLYGLYFPPVEKYLPSPSLDSRFVRNNPLLQYLPRDRLIQLDNTETEIMPDDVGGDLSPILRKSSNNRSRDSKRRNRKYDDYDDISDEELKDRIRKNDKNKKKMGEISPQAFREYAKKHPEQLRPHVSFSKEQVQSSNSKSNTKSKYTPLE